MLNEYRTEDTDSSFQFLPDYLNEEFSFFQKILYEKSRETEIHSRRLHQESRRLGKIMGLDKNHIDQLSLLAALHDIGKISIPESILNKPAALTENEWDIMKSHSESGYWIANAVPEFSCVSKEILTHHERWDGKGYPLGLSGEEIPLLARVISVIDAYDVMINGRIYKKAISKEEAIEELLKNAGSQFDPKVVQNFIEMIRKT